MNTIMAILRSEKNKKSAAPQEYRFLSYEECLSLRNKRVQVVDKNGMIGEVAITSIKTWKTRPEIVVAWKFGLYEYGKETVSPSSPQQFFVSPVHPLAQ